MNPRLTPELVLSAYCQGCFPMADPETGEISFYEPDPRALIPLDERFHIPHGLKRVLNKKPFELRMDTAFPDVVHACARTDEPEEQWIDGQIEEVYGRLHEMGFGDYEGVKNIRQKPECPVYLLFEEPEKYVAKDGAESFEELYHRTGEFIEQVLRPQLEAGKNVLVVGHGAMNCSIVNQFRGTPIKDFWKDMQGNCELLRVE